MREKGLKRASVLFALLFALTAFFAAGTILFTGSTHAFAEDGGTTGETTPAGKALYFVDAGYLAANADGTGDVAKSRLQGDARQDGHPYKGVTPFMEKYGLSFGTDGLYNSSTDMLYGVDDVTGKSWGSENNTDFYTWRFVTGTACQEEGYSTGRYIREAGKEDGGPLTYKFEVDDDTTALKLYMGVYGEKDYYKGAYKIKINGGSEQDVTEVAKNETKQFTFSNSTTGETPVAIKGVKEGEVGSEKCFVTVDIGVKQTPQAYFSWLLLTTADYDLNLHEVNIYSLPTFVKKGDTQITLKGSLGNDKTVPLNQNAQDAIAGTNAFEETEISVEYGGKTYTENVTVLPQNTLYFIDLPNAQKDGAASADAEYSAESKCGYVGTPMTVKSNGSSYIDTGRYGANNTTTLYTYRFDMDTAGSYGVRVGTYGWWANRKLGFKVNDGNEKVIDTTNGQANKGVAYGETVEDEGKNKLELTIRSAEKDGACVTYILVFAAKKITFNTNGGSEIAPVYFESGTEQTVTEPPAPTKDKHRFDGWYSDAELQNEYSFENAKATDNLVLYAKWTPVYTVTFNSQGGSTVPSTTAASGETITEPATAPTKTGYTFGGWYTDEDCTAGQEWTFNTDTVTTADVVLYAKWTANTYTLTWNLNGGNGENSEVQVTYDAPFTLPTNNPTRTGYDFANWYTEATGGTQVQAGTWATDDDATYYAHWTPKTYTITWNVNGGNGDNSDVQVQYGAAFALPTPAPTRTGYTFAGWFTDATNGTQVQAGTWATDDDATYYAHWTLKQYTITWNANDGAFAEPPSATTVSYGETLTLPATAPTRTGYTFAGWNTVADGTGTTVAAGDVTLDVTAGAVTLYAQWTAKTYTITWNVNGGNGENSDVQVQYGAAFALPTTDPTRTGYAFAGWFTDATNGTQVQAGTWATDADATYYAHWVQQFTVAFNAQGGSTVASANVTNGGKVTKPTDPTREGYTFGGWYKEEACTTEWNFTTDTVTADTTLYAKWTQNASSGGGKKKGCGSFVMAETSAVIAALMLALAGAILLKKRAEKKN